MKNTDEEKSRNSRPDGIEGENNLPGYPSYPASEDIYKQYEEAKDINPEDITKPKVLNSDVDSIDETDENTELLGSDLDVPGSELDDAMEHIGSEDEENNYYSLGGDAHSDLDENNG